MFARTTYTQLIARRLPYVAMWGTGLGAFLCWPHVVAEVSNRVHQVPPMNANVYRH